MAYSMREVRLAMPKKKKKGGKKKKKKILPFKKIAAPNFKEPGADLPISLLRELNQTMTASI